MGGFDWSSTNQAACPDFYTSHVGWVISFEIFRCRMPEFMVLTTSFYSLVNGLRAGIYRIGEVISGATPIHSGFPGVGGFKGGLTSATSSS